MEFISIPEQGSSWREALEYSFSTGSSQPQDLTVEILDAETMELLGTMRLYGVTQGRVNIAPYIKNCVSMTPPSSSDVVAVVPSPSAISVVVRVGGVLSEERLFFRSAVGEEVVSWLGELLPNQEVERGDVVRLTLCPKQQARLVVSYSGSVNERPMDRTIEASGCPMELMLRTEHLKAGDSIIVALRLASGEMQSLRYVVLPRRASSKRLVWYNMAGGVEGYTFGHSVRLGYSVDVEDVVGCNGEQQRGVDGRVRYRLCSGYESAAMVEHVVELLLSPVVFLEQDGVLRSVMLESREVLFDSKGQLRTLTLEISEAWGGGEL